MEQLVTQNMHARLCVLWQCAACGGCFCAAPNDSDDRFDALSLPRAGPTHSEKARAQAAYSIPLLLVSGTDALHCITVGC